MRLKTSDAQALFENDLRAAGKYWRGLLFDPADFAAHVLYPPESRRYRGRADNRLTWLWTFAATTNHEGRTFFLVGRPEKWPELHMVYGVASMKPPQQQPTIDTFGHTLNDALSWD